MLYNIFLIKIILYICRNLNNIIMRDMSHYEFAKQFKEVLYTIGVVLIIAIVFIFILELDAKVKQNIKDIQYLKECQAVKDSVLLDSSNYKGLAK